MEKNPFQISAVQNGKKAEIRITGLIGWETTSESFRTQVEALVKAGVKDAHLYIHSPGGNCFDAVEIVNIITQKFKGSITGEGGALVASAATFIAANCKTFEMPENGMFMIHRASGGIRGSQEDIEAYLKLMKDTNTMIYESYKAIAKDLTLLDEKWNSRTDWWLTAKEAKEQGFITAVRQKARIDRETAAQIKACGCPFEIPEDQIYKPKNEKRMELQATAKLLGLPATATEEEVKAKLEANAKAATDLQALQAAQAEREKTEKAAKINAALDKAIADKRIKADCRAEWNAMLEANFEKASKALESIASVEKLSSEIF